ncbi:MAG: hypothetical protein M0Z77_04695 [Thermoplasmatales archaeon]|nr:hypothetical protein [Candidatus Thermoplasmatota archaeon]MCL6002917.1 hypothetical protein [Candidatus Thermoplasmatota archaeon]MDA8054933.1 hypothetical protein [Thermoplasmatales archaeon]
MKSRTWKIASVAMVLLIIVTFVFTQGFHYALTDGTASQYGNPDNGTLIVIEALPNVNVKYSASFTYVGIAHTIAYENGTFIRAPGEIVLQHGSEYLINDAHSYLNLTGYIQGRLFAPAFYGSVWPRVNLSAPGSYVRGDPIAVAILNNFPYSDFNSQYLNQRLANVGYVAIFVYGYAYFEVKVVAMPI